ncbi:otopetrin-3-like isoform X2 [Pundamilia nyererei]|uniref:Otopetrin-3-like isoform X2 n=1 Tax=Pundamilia nyererei TaxID=303518 RepID=A0A9Y3QPV2_9CICH|nr:PREDICTED: otopetrin-3-like isoform X2 [Pundamilia nyererei]
MSTDRDAGDLELDTVCGTPENPTSEPLQSSDHHQTHEQELDPVLLWVPSGRRLISGLVGLNVVLLGTALVIGENFNPEGLSHQEPEVFLLVLMGISLIWMFWYLLWARRHPDISPHRDHHAGGVPVIHIFTVGSLQGLHSQTQDNHKVCRSGLMMILSTDLLLWLNAVTEDNIHVEIELGKRNGLADDNTIPPDRDSSDLAGNSTCQCNVSTACLAFRKGFEIFFPFNIEYYLMAGCLIYVMWKNVGRITGPDHHVTEKKKTLYIVCTGGITLGLVFGGLVLAAGVTAFVLYQVYVSQPEFRLTAFFIFYGYHLVVMPIMSLCSLVGLIVQRLESRAREVGPNPSRRLDVVLLMAAALGQLALSYFSVVAALGIGTDGPLGELDLSYSLLSLLELILQNIFIIEGLHRHPHLSIKKKKKKKQMSSIFKMKKKKAQENKKTDISLLEAKISAPPTVQEQGATKPWAKRVRQEICAFLILSNIMLWLIPAFGVHPQFENGLGKEFFGFTTWFIMMNLGQPLSVFYRMHSVAALTELLISA